MSSDSHTDARQRLRALPWRRLIAIISTATLLGYLIVALATNWRALGEYEWEISPEYLVASLLAYLLSLFFGALAWHRMVWSMDQRVQGQQGIKFFLQSTPARRIPGFVWYALGRLYLYEREGIAKSTVSVALSLELVTMIMGGMIAYAATAWQGTAEVAPLQQWWLLVPLAALIAVVIWPQGLYRVINWILVRRGEAPIRNQADRRHLLHWSLIQAGAWAFGGLFVFFLAAGIYPALGWDQIVSVIWSWAASGLVALAALIVPLGLGLKEATFAYLLSAFVPWPVAVLISLLARVCSIIGDCLGLLIAIFL
ncbi:MAG: lysylphosphatidylglycerol synthase domain-containing protein [Anaerolineae bacterium]|nr:lysylphosphatidylglycerol synthase domain-containing protein [Anaerolineae bacterium]